MTITKTKTINVATHTRLGKQTVKVITIRRTHYAHHIETEAEIRWVKPPTIVQWLMRLFRL